MQSASISLQSIAHQVLKKKSFEMIYQSEQKFMDTSATSCLSFFSTENENTYHNYVCLNDYDQRNEPELLSRLFLELCNYPTLFFSEGAKRAMTFSWLVNAQILGSSGHLANGQIHLIILTYCQFSISWHAIKTLFSLSFPLKEILYIHRHLIGNKNSFKK